jgi:hypothetical protein
VSVFVSPSLSGNKVGIPIAVSRSSIPSPPIPLFTLRLPPHDDRRKTRGQDGLLFLLDFIPYYMQTSAHCQAPVFHRLTGRWCRGGERRRRLHDRGDHCHRIKPLVQPLRWCWPTTLVRNCPTGWRSVCRSGDDDSSDTAQPSGIPGSWACCCGRRRLDFGGALSGPFHFRVRTGAERTALDLPVVGSWRPGRRSGGFSLVSRRENAGDGGLVLG